jgi:hypothetical protein
MQKEDHNNNLNDILESDATKIHINYENIVVENIDKWDFYSNTIKNRLSVGNIFFSFKFFDGMYANDNDIKLMDSIINLSMFENENIENNVPHINVKDKEDINKYKFVLSKTMYLIPELDINDIDIKIWSSKKFCEECIGDNARFDDIEEKNSFRMNKDIFFWYSICVQMQLSEIKNVNVLNSMKNVAEFDTKYGILYERVKRNKEKIDNIAKAKSVLLFHNVRGGVILTDINVIVINKFLPDFLLKFVDKFKMSDSEISQIIYRRRKYIREQYKNKTNS